MFVNLIIENFKVQNCYHVICKIKYKVYCSRNQCMSVKIPIFVEPRVCKDVPYYLVYYRYDLLYKLAVQHYQHKLIGIYEILFISTILHINRIFNLCHVRELKFRRHAWSRRLKLVLPLTELLRYSSLNNASYSKLYLHDLLWNLTPKSLSFLASLHALYVTLITKKT